MDVCENLIRTKHIALLRVQTKLDGLLFVLLSLSFLQLFELENNHDFFLFATFHHKLKYLMSSNTSQYLA